MKIGIYGGSFDPPHLGHAAAAEAAVKELSLDKLLIIPAGQPPHKQLSAGVPEPQVRLEMAKLAFAGVSRAQVTDIELQRQGKSYTVDTLSALSVEHPQDQFVLLMGTDMAATFTQWYQADRITELAALAAFSRNAQDGILLEKAAADIRAFCGAELQIVQLSPVEVSSTELRRLLPERQGRELLHPAVYEHIIARRLYGAQPELAWLRAQAKAGMKPSRAAHTDGCEETAARLALHWGADETELRQAAILHDITRGVELDTQLQMCKAYDIIADAEEIGSRALLHALTGSVIAEKCFGMSPEICSQIRWHTTGRPDMTLQEKILYLADAAEPNRDYPGVEELRRLIYTDIDRAMIFALENTISHTKKQGITPHPRSEQALEQLKGICR